MKTKRVVFVFLALVLLSPSAGATKYVSPSGSHEPPFESWPTAATNIQAAVDACSAGDTVLVTNGVYATGGRAVYGAMTNRLTIPPSITVQSVNGAANTFILGQACPTNNANGDGAIRCAWVGNGAALIGFTLTNGHTRMQGVLDLERSGGGVWCEVGGVVSNCVLRGNSASEQGGGALNGMLYNCAVSSNNAFYGGGTAGSTLNHCAVFGNTADAGGGAFNGIFSNCTFSANSATGYYGFAGGVYQGTLWNCTVSGNRAMTGDGGGGAYASGLNNCTVTHNYAGKGAGAVHSTLNNCTITDNQASVGGGVYLYCFLRNCIVYDNTASGYSNYDNTCMLWHSCSTPLAPGSGNITNGPAFVNAADGNYRLQPNSPCINAGKNAYVRGNTDLDDNPRVVGGTVDMGAYEYQTPASTISYAWLQQYGLPADGSADFADPDSDALNNWQEWRADTDPTNAASTLRMLAPTRTLSGVTISWASVTTRSYSVERATNLCASPAFSLVQSNIPGQAGATSFTDTNTVAGTTRFYRVRVEE